jgi:hypothetical protein
VADVEDLVRRYADAAIAAAPPVTLDEVLSRSGHGRSPLRWVAVAAAVLLVLGLAAAVLRQDEGTNVAARSAADFPLSLDGHRDWVVAVLNRQVEVSESEYQRRYADVFVGAIPLDRFRETNAQVAARGPWSVLREVERRDETVLAVQLGSSSGEQMRLTLHRAADGRLDASTVLNTVPCAAPVAAEADLSPALRVQLDWLDALFGSDRTPSSQEVAEHLAPGFLRQIGGEGAFVGLLPQVRRVAPLTRRAFEGPPRELGLTARLGVNTGEEARLTLEIETAAPHRISSFGILTTQPCRD